MQIRQLNLCDIEKIYNEDIVYQFPPEEMKPFSSMAALYAREMYLCFGLYETETLIAYAFFVRHPAVRQVLLDYYVVCRPYRNCGYGSSFLSLLCEECSLYDGMLVEVENPSYAENNEDRAMQMRRVEFYERNGFRVTPIEVNLFDTEYSIMVRGMASKPDDAETFASLDALYHEMLGEWYAEKVFFHGLEGRHGA